MQADVPRIAALPASWVWPALAVGIGFILGGITALTLYRADATATLAPQYLDHLTTVEENDYSAHLIGSTACLWDGASSSRKVGSKVGSGEAVHLLEGLAKFYLNWARRSPATLSSEGPAAMVLTSDGLPTLRFGR